MTALGISLIVVALALLVVEAHLSTGGLIGVGASAAAVGGGALLLLSAGAGAAQSVAKHATVQLDGSAVGVRGNVSFVWRLDAVPPGSTASLSAADSARPSFVPDQAGVYVASVVPGSPAAQAGLKEGDVITAIDGKPATTTDDLAAVTLTRNPGDTVTVEYIRDGRPEKTKVTLGVQP